MDSIKIEILENNNDLELVAYRDRYKYYVKVDLLKCQYLKPVLLQDACREMIIKNIEERKECMINYDSMQDFINITIPFGISTVNYFISLDLMYKENIANENAQISSEVFQAMKNELDYTKQELAVAKQELAVIKQELAVAKQELVVANQELFVANYKLVVAKKINHK